MNILITGGAGFIGSHLIDKLIDSNNIICVDKLIFGDSNIKHLKNNKNFKFYNFDIINEDILDKIFKENNIDIVYHLAANSDIKKGGEYPDIDFNDTFLTTKSLLNVMKNNNVKKLFFASTSAVYGDKNEILNELTGDLRPISYYGSAKLASEAFISSYAYMNDFNVVVFRFPNVIGDRLTHGVIYDFINKLKNNPNELLILGNGKQCKPYIYVNDLVDAIIKFTKDFDSKYELYNISVEGLTTVDEIANIIIKEMNLENVNIKYSGDSVGWKGDVSKFRYDISKIMNKGYKPNYTSNEAVIKTVKDMLGD